MTGLTYLTTLSGGSSPFLQGITDLLFDTGGPQPVLYLISRAGGGIAAYRLSESGSLTLIDQALLESPPTTELGLASLQLDGSTLLVSSEQAAGGISAFALEAGGGLAPSSLLAGQVGLQGDALVVASVELGGRTFLFVGRPDAPGLDIYELAPDRTLSPVGRIADTAALYAADTAAAVVVDVAGTPMLFAVSSQENGLTGYRIGSDGTLAPAHSLGAAQGLPISTPTGLATLQIGQETYLVVAAAGSSSLTVVRVLDGGRMAVTDHIVDTLDTRFQNVTALETVVIDGRAFVIAAGADDGISVFAVLPGGRLLHIGTIADTDGMTLQNVSAIAASVVDGAAMIFVSSETEPGLTGFRLHPGTIGITSVGGAGADSLQGGADDEILVGDGGDDVLDGRGGSDILVDGTGSDQMRGGAGADIFVFHPDGVADTILDFQVGIDRLDLSAYFMLYDVRQLTIVSTATGAEIRFGNELIIVQSADGMPIPASAFTTAGVINMPRVPSSIVWMGRVFDGTPTHDALEGGPVGDVLSGLDGDDTILGHDGNDLIFGDGGADRVNGGRGADTLHGGAGEDFLIGDAGNDVLYGGDGYDLLYGGADNDTIDGGRHSDQVFGEAGNDVLYGGDGFDYIAGGTGNDLIYGGNGNDRLLGGNDHDTLWGGTGNDTIWGGPSGNDILRGEDGDDVMYGEAGADWMHGGIGNDTLIGGNGFDTLIGGEGHDSLDGSLHADKLYGGTGNDTLLGGEGNDELYGEAGADVLDGGTGNDLLSGGADGDTFVFSGAFGDDTILDFDAQGGLDRIDLRQVAAIADWADLQANHMVQAGSDVVITDGSGNSITLENVSLADLDAGDFIF